MCGWAIDSIIWYTVRDKILKGRYAGCIYSMADSFSPIIINYRGEVLPEETMKEIADLFPENIRVEFQQVTYEGEINRLYGRGDFIMYGKTYDTYPVPIVVFELKEGKWVPK